jgi:2-phosphoglycolate phosphatase
MSAAVGRPRDIRALLFDLDGTLLDTALDLLPAIDQLLAQQDRPPCPPEILRPLVSQGSGAMLAAAFGIDTQHRDMPLLKERFLELYRQRIAVATRPFPGIESLLGEVEQRGMPWGVVTNKPGWLTLPLLEQLGFRQRASCIVSGDTTAHAKPHPGPLLHASEQLGVATRHCLYLGDAEKDMQAARAAGMFAVAAGFGYLAAGDRPERWPADLTIEHPEQLRAWLQP